MLDCVWNVMAHAQKPDFVFRRNGRVHLIGQGRQFSRLLAAEVCASVVVMLDTPCSEVVWSYWIPTRFVSSPFTSPPVRHRVPSRFNWTLLHHPNLKLEDHPLSTVRDSLFITFSAALYDWRPSPSSATRGRTISWWQGPNYHGQIPVLTGVKTW